MRICRLPLLLLPTAAAAIRGLPVCRLRRRLLRRLAPRSATLSICCCCCWRCGRRHLGRRCRRCWLLWLNLGHRLCCAQLLGAAEINQLQVALAVQQQVLGLQVSMHLRRRAAVEVDTRDGEGLHRHMARSRLGQGSRG